MTIKAIKILNKINHVPWVSYVTVIVIYLRIELSKMGKYKFEMMFYFINDIKKFLGNVCSLCKVKKIILLCNVKKFLLSVTFTGPI